MPVQDRYSHFLRDQRKFFDEMVTEDRESYFNQDWDFTRLFEVQQLFRKTTPSKVLDIGCGDGFRDMLMANYSYVTRVDAFDYSEKSIQMANELYPHPKINRFVADFAELSLETEYDLVVSFQVFEHLFNPDEYLEFCFRSCKPGGIVAICTPNRLTLDNRINILKKKPLILVDVMHSKEYIPAEIFDMGKRVGLKPRGYFGHTIFSYYGINLFKRLSVKQRTRLGSYMPFLANIICVLLER